METGLHSPPKRPVRRSRGAEKSFTNVYIGSPSQQPQAYYSSAPAEPAFSQGYVTVAEPMSSNRGPLHPSPPPMRSDSVVETAHSPTSMVGQSYYLGSSLNNVEPHQQRAMPVKRHSVPMPSGGMYTTSPYTMAYNSSPSAMSTSSYYSADGVYDCGSRHSRTEHVGASSLYRAFEPGNIPSITGSLRLSDLQQSILAAEQSQDSQLQPYRREAVQVHTAGMWQGIQCAE
jgi:hypothetical protein